MKGKHTEKILIVDDSPETVELIRRHLEPRGYEIFTSHNVRTAIKTMNSVHPDLVITDLRMPDQNGIHLVRHIKENHKDMGVLVITGYPSIEGAVESIREGAEEYLVKTFTDKELFAAVDRALGKVLLLRKGQSRLPVEHNAYGIIGESQEMQKVFKAIGKVQKTKATVLITGESGTGKELVARAIHYGTHSPATPFIAVNCGGIPDSLLESELFGYAKGAFTGAQENRQGFFQVAHGGTIFLDEISNTSLSMQAKLLRVLQEKEFYMVGSKVAEKVNVRVIAATNVSLPQLVKQKLFREDLYYRLNVITIDLPPLRQRGDDIMLLARYFLNKYSQEISRPPLKLTEKALSVLKKYPWPGNVRELQNLMHSLVVMNEDAVIDVPDLPDSLRFSALGPADVGRTLEQAEHEYIKSVLSVTQNNISKAAEILGITRKTLREKMKKASGG